MSTVKAVNFQHPSSTAANLTLAADGSLALPSANTCGIDLTVTGATTLRAYAALSNNTTDSYLAFSAEL